MPNSERPPRGDDADDREPESTRGEHREGAARKIVERMLKEGVRRAVEKGVEQVTEAPENLRQLVQDMRLPREIATLLLQQADDTKNGLYRAVAKELRDFLNETNVAEEMVKALTTLSFEIKTEIRFIPNDQKDALAGKAVKPDVKASVRIKDSVRPEKDREKEIKNGD